MLYGLETVALTKRQQAKMEVAELKIFYYYDFLLGVTRMDKIRNEYIRGTAQVGRFGEKHEARLRGFRHVQRKDNGYIMVRMMELRGKRKCLKGGLSTRWESTRQWQKWHRRTQAEPNGDEKFAVATLDGKSRKKKTEGTRTNFMWIIMKWTSFRSGYYFVSNVNTLTPNNYPIRK